MDLGEVEKVLKINENIKSSSSTTVNIDHVQVINIVVNDLLRKYRYALESDDTELIPHLKIVLLYYVSGEELEEFMSLG